MNLLKEIVYRLRPDYTTERLIKNGLKVGNNFKRMHGTILDPSHCWLITIGNDVTLAPRVHILCHDASMKNLLGYSQIGRVNIGNNVFIGASTVVLPGVSIGNNVVIGANSTVTHDIPDNSVAAGNPARVIKTIEEFCKKHQELLHNSPVYDESFTFHKITPEKKEKQRKELARMEGYIK